MNKIFFFLLLCAAGFMGCEKNDSAAAFGVPTIYMPQATVSGGNNANYPVPSGLDSATRNYVDDPKGGMLDVLLGVSRSGKVSNEAFAVDIKVNKDTINQLITAGMLDPSTILMPDDVYSLPSSVSVAAGHSSEYFFLALDKGKLKTYAGKKLAIAVGLANPSKYRLNPTLSTTIVIVNVNALSL